MKKENKSLSDFKWKVKVGHPNKEKTMFEGKKIKEFIKIVERIIIERKSRRLQLIELKNAAGKDLI